MKRIAILMSDTGGGHRAAANALTAGLEMRYPGMVQVDLVDMFRQYSSFPFNRAPEIYPLWLRYSTFTYALCWRALDIFLHAPFMFWPGWGRFFAGTVRHIAATYQPDLLICVHSAFGRSTVAGRDYAGLNLPVCCVILDPAEGAHQGWFHPNLDRCLVMCAESQRRALAAGIPESRVHRIGFPVRPRFALYHGTRAEARQELGWDADRPTVLVMAGADGVGPLEAIVRAIHERAPDAQLVVGCGKNEKLRQRLQSLAWQRPPHLYGFVSNGEVLLRAADLIVMKGGPASVFEAALMGTPMIISGAIPYQETGSSNLAVNAGAARFCTKPRRIAEIVADLLRPENPELARMATACSTLVTPESVFNAADEIAALLGLTQPSVLSEPMVSTV